jgi:hypothetical protein
MLSLDIVNGRNDTMKKISRGNWYIAMKTKLKCSALINYYSKETAQPSVYVLNNRVTQKMNQQRGQPSSYFTAVGQIGKYIPS